MFRLALEVSATRLILLTGDAGEVVDAFGNFVVARQLRGRARSLRHPDGRAVPRDRQGRRSASRRSRARFTLDAMPGKQMSIDADLRAGAHRQEEAQRRRRDSRA